jgi:hypothetical protein
MEACGFYADCLKTISNRQNPVAQNCSSWTEDLFRARTRLMMSNQTQETKHEKGISEQAEKDTRLMGSV